MKRFLIAISIISNLFLAKAQESFKPSFQIGAHYGINYGDVRFKPTISSTPVQMDCYGLVFIYESEPHLGIQIEANMAQKGWKSGSDTTIKHTRKMSYLEFPVLTHISVGKKLFRFHVNIGPYFSYYRESFQGFSIADPVADTAKSVVFQSYEYNQEYGSEPNSNFDFGFTGGIAFGFFSKKLGEITLRLRYNQGLSNLFPQYPEGQYRFSQIRTYYVGVSYAYVIKRKSTSAANRK